MADPAVYNAILQANKCIQEEIQTQRYSQFINTLSETPWDTTNWSNIPLISNPTGCLCVFDNSTCLRLDACCQWTVPGGTTKVQFQIWGAGAGSTMLHNCGGSPFGATGAYATVIIDAVPGCQYTLCAGCAFCCYACNAQNTSTGCPSYVTGFGLTNFCAMGGCAGTFRAMSILHGTSCCRYQARGFTTAGNCICLSGSAYCGNGCATCGCIPWQADPDLKFYGSATTGTVFGIPSIHSSGCIDSNIYGYHEHPPVISPCHTAQPNSCCCFSFSSGSCCGGCRCRPVDGALCYPGAGGFATHMMGGSTAWAGDSGRGGMVRVTWC